MIVARVVSVVSGVRAHFALRMPEWLLTFILMWWGLALLQEPRTFSSSPAFAAMARLAGERTWGWCLLAVALARFLALVLNGTFRSFARFSPLVRSVAAAFSAAAWFSIFLGLAVTWHVTPGLGTYAGLFAGDMVLAFLVAEEAGIAEKAHRHARSVRRRS